MLEFRLAKIIFSFQVEVGLHSGSFADFQFVQIHVLRWVILIHVSNLPQNVSPR